MTLEVPHVETPEESLDRLRLAVEELRASRERLVQAADADRRRIEHDLHDGPQQHLIALAINLQLARRAAHTDPDAVSAHLEEIDRDLQRALDAMGRLAQRIYPPLLEAAGLGAALRAAAASSGVQARIDVTAEADYPAEVARAVYFSCIEVLEWAGDEGRASVTVREDEGAVLFDAVVDGSRPADELSDILYDRVDALGGRLTVESEPDHVVRVSGSVPLSR